MDNVLNRPLFRHREARDRLNDIAGVQRFRDGGPVFEGSGRQPVRPEGLNTNWRGALTMTGGVPSPIAEGINFESVVLNPGTTMAQQFLYDKKTGQVRNSDGSRLPSSAEAAIAEALRSQEEVSAGTGLASLQRESDRLLEDSLKMMRLGEGPSGVMLAERLGDVKGQIPGAEAAYESAASRTPFRDITTRDILAAEGPEALISQLPSTDRQRTLDIFNTLDRAADRAAPEAVVPVPKGPSGMEQEARGRRPAASATSAPIGPSGMEQEARGRGPLITDPAAVAAGLNAEDPAIREKTTADFMKEYTDAAPKYEGMDKGLLLAQIGFAIAAGESPNAMQNIANGLLAGSQVLSQDKAAKAEFDRQLQLNALQYGLEGVASEREKGKPALQFIATKDMKWKGRPVKEGSPVYLSYKDIADAGGVVPDGLVDAATSAALIEKTQGVTKAYQDAYDRGVIDDTELRLATEGYAEHATRVAKSQRALDYFEKTLFKLGEEGNLTGIEGSFQKLIGKLGSAAGFTASDLDVLAKSGDAAEMEELLYRGVINTVPAVVEGQSANSISDTDVRLAMKGLVDLAIAQGTFSSLFTNEKKVMRQIQDSMDLIAGNRQRAFAEMSAIEARLANRYTKAGDFYNPAYATDVLRPLREASGLTEQPEMVSTYGDMVLGENGTYKLILPGG